MFSEEEDWLVWREPGNVKDRNISFRPGHEDLRDPGENS